MRTVNIYNTCLVFDSALPSPALSNFPRFAGGSAATAGALVEKQGGKLLQYLFIAELTSLGGQSKLKAPVYSMFQFDE